MHLEVLYDLVVEKDKRQTLKNLKQENISGTPSLWIDTKHARKTKRPMT
jgi:hypothetical protein